MEKLIDFLDFQMEAPCGEEVGIETWKIYNIYVGEDREGVKI